MVFAEYVRLQNKLDNKGALRKKIDLEQVL